MMSSPAGVIVVDSFFVARYQAIFVRTTGFFGWVRGVAQQRH